MPIYLEFAIPGLPIPQGSKTLTRYGGIRDANKHLPEWRRTLIIGIRQAMADTGGNYPDLGPVRVEAEFMFPRPRGHYGTGRNADTVRASAPGKFHAQKPDLDKLCRALGDALTQSGALRDDTQIAQWDGRKYWGNRAGAFVIVESLP